MTLHDDVLTAVGPEDLTALPDHGGAYDDPRRR
jgi:hypothetical protein